jgi:endogenous inhibitor of DNA gyrase (YacG/DUF329 family)
MRIVCPLCRKVVENAPEDFPSRPFCSARCKLADLDNWLEERYRVPSPLEDGEEDDDGRNQH